MRSDEQSLKEQIERYANQLDEARHTIARLQEYIAKLEARLTAVAPGCPEMLDAFLSEARGIAEWIDDVWPANRPRLG